MRAALGGLTAVLLLCGCGVRPEPLPETVNIPPPTTLQADHGGDPGDPEVNVYLVRGARLAPVARSHPETGVDASLELLAAGPTRAEVVIAGLRTALPPLSLLPQESVAENGVGTIAVTRDFTDISGLSQLLAVAQVVWTVTEHPEVRSVRITAEGRPLEVPTDDGLTDQAVDRDDFRSVAPTEPPASEAPAPEVPGGTDGGAPDVGTPAPTAPTTGRRRATWAGASAGPRRRRDGPGREPPRRTP